MPLRYSTGEEIQSGDRIVYHGEPSQVEFIAERGDPETGWYVEEFGGGFMLLAPSFGRVFVSEPTKICSLWCAMSPLRANRAKEFFRNGLCGMFVNSGGPAAAGSVNLKSQFRLGRNT
jgi:hypothetical protein